MFAQESVMEIQKEKEAFEAWFESQYDAHFMQFAIDLDFYVDKHTQACWEAWLASANREGYKLVPLEPTQGMVDKAVCDTPETPSQDYWHDSQPISDDQAIACYKAMIEAQEPTND